MTGLTYNGKDEKGEAYGMPVLELKHGIMKYLWHWKGSGSIYEYIYQYVGCQVSFYISEEHFVVSPELSSVRDYVITHSVRSM